MPATAPVTTIESQIDDFTVILAVGALLPEGYTIWYTRYDNPALADIRRYAIWHKPAPRYPAGADFRARVAARRHAEAQRRQVGVIVDVHGDGTAWETFRPSNAKTAVGGLRSIGEWRYMSAAATDLVRVDRRAPRVDDQWRIR